MGKIMGYGIYDARVIGYPHKKWIHYLTYTYNK